ncbi:hypothetical protein KA082_01635 [Candidatus Woesebacteria bacterium]|nr:hypothetical protein [Candidatus Woesebacteria bacterium]
MYNTDMGKSVIYRLLFASAALCIACASFFAAVQPITAQDSFEALKKDIRFIHGQTAAMLLFTPFGTNPDPAFAKHHLSDGQVQELCAALGNCGNLGVNHGTVFISGDYGRIKQFNMKWSLEIARASDPGATIKAINENPAVNTIVRIGISGNSIGFADHTGNAGDYIDFLQKVAGGVGGKTFYAIAGPNEPDIEKWLKNDCGAAPGTYKGNEAAAENFYKCIGEPLARYMNAVCSAKAAGKIPTNVKLLSPAFNMTSYTFSKQTPSGLSIPHAMDAAGARWGCLDGVAGNLYPAGKSMESYWNDPFTGETIKFFKGKNLPIYITETGPTNAAIADSTSAIVEKKRDPFYIHPIKGLEIADTTIIPSQTYKGGIVFRKKDIIRDDLIKQGYEARCAAPSFSIELEQAGLDWMNHYLECRGDSNLCNDKASVEGETDDGKGDGAIFGGKSIDQFTGNVSPPNPLGKRVISVLSTDYRDALIPVFRDFDQVPQLKRSLEDYFGHTESGGSSYNLTELNSAAINSLLSTPQRCEQSAVSLLAREKMCDKLNDPNACALYEATVPPTNFTVKTLLTAFKFAALVSPEIKIDYTTPAGKKLITETCTNILKNDNQNLRTAMLSLPLQIQDSYRLAFLVTTIRTRVPRSGKMMNLFQHPQRDSLNEEPDPHHVVIVSAFKVPDITTNKGTIADEGESGDIKFSDPAQLTRDVLISTPVREKLESDGQKERLELLNKGREIQYKPQEGAELPIRCREQRIGNQQCLDATTAALVDLINAQGLIEQSQKALTEEQKLAMTDVQRAQLNKLNHDGKDGPGEGILDCSEPVEKPSVILDSADLNPISNAGRIFRTEMGVAILENIFSDESHFRPEDLKKFDPTYADTESNKVSGQDGGGKHWGLKSIFHVTQRNQNNGSFVDDGEGRVVNTYVVYPVGYDEKTIEAVISGSFFDSSQLETLKTKAEEYQNLQIAGDTTAFTGGKISSGPFTNYNVKDGEYWCGELKGYDAASGDPIYAAPCPVGSFSFALDINKQLENAHLLGGRLGFWLHTVQQSLQKATALTHKYLENCTTTEDFLLDQCGGASTNETAVGAQEDKDFASVGSFPIKYWNGSDVTFSPPSQELWDAVKSASSQYGCDPWLLLATAHAESPTFENSSVPNASGESGLFQFSPLSWEKWKLANPLSTSPTDPTNIANANHRLSRCDFWQPKNFTIQGKDFSSPANLRAAADSACRKILWTGMQSNPPKQDKSNLSSFIQRFADKGASPDGETWSPGQATQAEYVYRLWGELLKRSTSSPVAQTTGYPYPTCTGKAPQPAPQDAFDYTGRTTLPATGQATYYSPTVMNSVLAYRERAEIEPNMINNCEIITADASLSQQFAELQANAERNGTGKFVGCAALLRLGDVPFYTGSGSNNPGGKTNIRSVWVKAPPGAPSEIPAVVGPIAVIDVAAKNDFPTLKAKGWVIDLDYYTFKRLFGWQGGWQRPQEGVRICEQPQDCQL